MPKIRPGMPKPPKAFELVDSILNEFEARMKDAIADSHDGKRKAEITWGVAAINRERTRKIFTMCKHGEIPRDVLDYCIKVNFIDGSLVKLWSIPGYETACCADCAQSKKHDFGGACICRVPAKDRAENEIQCRQCGCTGCAVGKKKTQPAKAEPGIEPAVESGQQSVE